MLKFYTLGAQNKSDIKLCMKTGQIYSHVNKTGGTALAENTSNNSKLK